MEWPLTDAEQGDAPEAGLAAPCPALLRALARRPAVLVGLVGAAEPVCRVVEDRVPGDWPRVIAPWSTDPRVATAALDALIAREAPGCRTLREALRHSHRRVCVEHRVAQGQVSPEALHTHVHGVWGAWAADGGGLRALVLLVVGPGAPGRGLHRRLGDARAAARLRRAVQRLRGQGLAGFVTEGA